jgi:hypothetical protein
MTEKDAEKDPSAGSGSGFLAVSKDDFNRARSTLNGREYRKAGVGFNSGFSD